MPNMDALENVDNNENNLTPEDAPQIFKIANLGVSESSSRRQFLGQLINGIGLIGAASVVCSGCEDHEVYVDKETGECTCHVVGVSTEGVPNKGVWSEIMVESVCTCDLVCTCNSVAASEATLCSCDQVCTCDTQGGSTTYWYPN